MLPIKWINKIQPHESKETIPVQRVSVTHTPLTVKSLGLTQTQYKMSDTGPPSWSDLSNLDLMFQGITSVVGLDRIIKV